MPAPYTPRRIQAIPVTPRLSSILSADCFESCWARALPYIGARSVVHIANMWDSPEELYRVLEDRRSGLLQLPEVTRVWGASDDQCSRQALVPGTVPPPFPELLPDASRPKRCISESWPRDSILRRKVSPAVEGSLVSKGAASDAKEASRALQLTSAMWSLFVDVGACGHLWEPYACLHGDLHDMHESMFKEAWADIPVSTLRTSLSVASRWKAWAVRLKVPWRKPSQAHVALWLRTLRSRGPTAPHGTLTVCAGLGPMWAYLFIHR